jgi:WD40 repeat protein
MVLAAFAIAGLNRPRLFAQQPQITAREYKKHLGRITALCVSPSGRTLLSADTSGLLLKWDLMGKQDILRLGPAKSEISGIAFASGELVAVTSHFSKELCFWDLATGKLSRTIKASDSMVVALAASPRQAMIASGDLTGSLKLWDATTGNEIGVLGQSEEGFYSAAFSPDGRFLAAGDAKGVITIWDMGDQKVTAELKGHGTVIRSLAFSPDGSLLASGSQDCSAKIWDCKTWKETATVGSGLGIVGSVAFSGDGQCILFTTCRFGKFTSAQSALKMYSIRSRHLRSIRLPQKHFYSVLASVPNSARFVVGTDTSEVLACTIQRRLQKH